MKKNETIDGVVGAYLALADLQNAALSLRAALNTIHTPHPAYRPGSEPTYADHLRNQLDMLDKLVSNIEIFLQ